MPENNQASDATKPETTDSSSTQPGSQAVDMNHTNAIVPHQISNHDKLVQTMVMVDGEWVNVNDTNDQKNAQEDMHKVNRVVTEAQKDIINAQNAADSAVKSADSAISASKANSDAIVAQSAAISEAKSAISSATAAIQQTAATAASDAAKIRADVAQVQNEVNTAKAANSASVEALKSDVSAAKQDLADVHDSLTKAQSAIEQNQKAIDNSIAQINSDIEQDRKDIASAQQANADTAKQLDTYSKQAQDQGKTIKSIQDKQDGFTATIADVQGNVTQVSDKVDGLSASLKDAQDNVASVKAQADQLSATLTDHAKSIATLTASANELSSTLEDADGRLSKVEQTAQTNSSTLSDVQGDLSQVKQDATTLTTTLKDAQGNISTLQQKADSVSAQLASAQGDITSLQTDVTGIKATLVSHEGDIHTLQADSKSLHDSMQDAQGDISTLKKTSTDVASELKDHAGRISKTEQTAGTLTNEFADQQGHLYRVEQTAQGTQQTVANQQGQINTIKTNADRISETLTGQGDQIASLNVTLNGLNTKYDGVSGDLSKLSDKVTTNSAQIDQNKKAIALKADQSTVDNLSGEVSQNKAQLKVQAGQISSKVSSTDFKTLNDKVNSDTGGGVNLLANSKGPFRPTGITTTTAADNYAIYSGSTIYMVQGQIYTISGQTNGVWSGTHDPNTVSDKCVLWLTDISNVSQIISANTMPHTFTWPYPTKSYHLRVNAYHRGADNPIYAEKVKIERGSTATPWTPAPEDTITAIQKNGTAIDQANKQISLKADQTEVDQVKQTATQNSSRLDVMADQIKSKVTSTDVNNIVDGKGYATTSTVQSLITQKAGTINESITSLDSKYNTTVTQVQSLTASIDGLQSTVANKADKSQITQLSNVIQSKVSSTDFNNLRKAVDLQALDSADINNMKTNGHYFVYNLANNPVGGWVYVDVTGNGADRIRQDVYQDSGNQHKYRRWFGDSWTAWSQGATESEITQLRDDINLRVKSGDLLSQINIQAGHTLIQSGKIYLDAKSVVFGKDSKAFIPAALITNLTADQITAGTLKSIQINNGGGKFTVNPNGDVVANSITLRNGQFMQGTIAGSTIYALNNNGSQDPKLAPKSDWYKITPNMIRWFNHYDQSVGQIGVGQGVMTAGDSSFTGTPGLTISDSTKILLGTAQRTIVTGDEIGNLETTGLDWMSKTNLEISVGLLRVNLDPDQGNEDNGKGAEFAIQKDNKIGAYFGSGDNGNELSITTFGDNNHITFNTGYFNVSGEVKIPDNGLTVRDLHVTRWLGVDGSKNSIVNTSQGTVAINAYETAEYYFGDIGEDQTSSDGKAWVSIEYLFSQTVNTNVPYQVFVTPYSSAHVWVSKRLNNRFLVESDKPNASFAWEIKAKRKGYEYTRLKNVDNMMEKPAGIN